MNDKLPESQRADRADVQVNPALGKPTGLQRSTRPAPARFEMPRLRTSASSSSSTLCGFLRSTLLTNQKFSRLSSAHSQEDLTQITMPYLDRAGVKIYYSTHGSGPPLLLSHGFSASSAMWQGQVDALSKSYTLILWDMRGHGQSDSPDDPAAYSEPHTVGDMEAILRQVCGTRPAIVGGLSLGGYMSLAFYRVYPERVRALLVIDTGPGFKKDAARESWNETAYKTAERFERQGLAYVQSRGSEARVAQHRSSKGLALAAKGMLTQRDSAVIQSLAGIRVPALVVVGADDAPFIAASEYMAKTIPGAKKLVIPDAGHAVNIDQPRTFTDGVLSFLTNIGTEKSRL